MQKQGTIFAENKIRISKPSSPHTVKTDERNVFISLTNEGLLLKKKATCVPQDLVCSIAKSNINNTKGAELLATLNQLMTSLTSE